MRIDKLRELPHWSYSAMQCYITCPLKYKFRYIDNAEPERTGSCFLFGKAFHAALSERARIGRDMSEREVCDVFEDYLKAETDAAENLVYKPPPASPAPKQQRSVASLPFRFKPRTSAQTHF